MKIRLIALASIAMLALAACDVSENGHYNLTTGPDKVTEDSPTSPDQVQIYEGTPDLDYTDLGPISVGVSKLTAFHSNPSREDALTALKEEAASRGANGVINVTVGDVKVTPLSWGARKISGTAVKF